MKMQRTDWVKMTVAAALCVLLLAAAWAGASPDKEPLLRASVPAGYDVIQLQPSGAVVSMMGLIECPDIEGARRLSEGLDGRIVSVSGDPMTRFPQHFSFRITASLRKTLIDPPSLTLKSEGDPAEMLLGLKFKLRAFDGLESLEVPPESVTMIGVPADVPYDERVYRVSFDVGNRPITDRFVLDVYSANGDRLSRFHFELL